MAKRPKKDEIKDEPGAEERFDRIMRRVLTTPPKHKGKKADSKGKGRKGDGP